MMKETMQAAATRDTSWMFSQSWAPPCWGWGGWRGGPPGQHVGQGGNPDTADSPWMGCRPRRCRPAGWDLGRRKEGGGRFLASAG